VRNFRRGALDSFEQPPADMGHYDWDVDEVARNEAYCREIEQRLLDAELDPKNFFRLGIRRKRIL
jgi:hypothetical protein